MTTDRPGRPAVRRGLVLGAGGVLGAAWTTAALVALEAATGADARDSEVVVGTSAGSVLSAFLGSGVSVDQMARHQRGIVVEGDPRIDYDHDRGAGGALPPRPRLRLGSTGLLRRTVLHPWAVTPTAALAAFLPEGRGSLDPVARLVASIAPATWPTAPEVQVVAMDYDTGRRVAFGGPSAPHAALAEAVRASCSIPGWYEPVRIAGRRFVDGGTCSATSLDLLAGRGLDEVHVLAPMAMHGPALGDDPDRPGTVVGRLERRYRAAVTRRLEREADKVRASGTRVVLVTPGPEDLRAIGVNLMDPRRRERVFATALRTVPALLAAAQEGAAAA